MTTTTGVQQTDELPRFLQLAHSFAEKGEREAATLTALQGILGFRDVEPVLRGVMAILESRRRVHQEGRYGRLDRHQDGELAVAAALHILPSNLLATDLISDLLIDEPPTLEDALRSHTFLVDQACCEVAFPERGRTSIGQRLRDLGKGIVLAALEMERLHALANRLPAGDGEDVQ